MNELQPKQSEHLVLQGIVWRGSRKAAGSRLFLRFGNDGL